MFVALGEDDGERDAGGGGWGGGGVRKPVSDKRVETNMTSAAAEKTPYLLLCGLCLAARSRGWPQRCGMTVRLCSYRIKRCLVCSRSK